MKHYIVRASIEHSAEVVAALAAQDMSVQGGEGSPGDAGDHSITVLVSDDNEDAALREVREALKRWGDISVEVVGVEPLYPDSDSASQDGAESTITAVLDGGPVAGRRIDVDSVEGRPPKTIDVPAEDGSRFRYCLADWVQSGASAKYTFLYRV